MAVWVTLDIGLGFRDFKNVLDGSSRYLNILTLLVLIGGDGTVSHCCWCLMRDAANVALILLPRLVVLIAVVILLESCC